LRRLGLLPRLSGCAGRKCLRRGLVLRERRGELEREWGLEVLERLVELLLVELRL
jgi:hypothetical protein